MDPEVEVPEVEVKGLVVEHEEVEVKTAETTPTEVPELAEEADQDLTPDTRLPDMLTCLPSRPVAATGPSGSPRTSVWSRAPVPGRTTGPQSPTIEVPTSSTKMKIRLNRQYTTCCIQKNQK